MKPLTAAQLQQLDTTDRRQSARHVPIRPVLRWHIDCTTGRPVSQWCLVPDPAEGLESGRHPAD